MILLQEEFKDFPWRMLVACVLLNQTTGKKVKTIIYDLFEKYPDQYHMELADLNELAGIIKPLGLQNMRAKRLVALSEACCHAGWEDRYDELPGVGKYASDSWKIFQLGQIDTSVTDKELKKYLDAQPMNGK